MENKKLIFHLTGDDKNVQLFIQNLNKYKSDEYGMRGLNFIATHELSTPVSSVFCDGKYRILTMFDIKNQTNKKNTIRFEIECDTNINNDAFDKLIDELFLKYELDQV